MTQQTPSPSGSAGSSGSSGSIEIPPETGRLTDALLSDIKTWIETYVRTVSETDYQLIPLWIVHTHVAPELYTTARLLIDSTLPGSGKTTLLEHLARLCYNPLQAASLSSTAVLVRSVGNDPRTVLVDEADRTLDPKNDLTTELLAVINSGYRRGATRPTLVPDKEQGWVTAELSTFCPLALAGNAPNLPDDTLSRCIRILLMPDYDAVVEDSDWELIENDAAELHNRIVMWADEVRETVRYVRPERPEGLRGRNRERWEPLLRIATLAGGEWEQQCRELIRRDIDDAQHEREDGIGKQPRHMTLLRDLAHHWPRENGSPKPLAPTKEIMVKLQMLHSEYWGTASPYGELTPQGFGRIVKGKFGIMSARNSGAGRERGYLLADFEKVWGRFHIDPPGKPDEPDRPAEPDEPQMLKTAR